MNSATAVKTIGLLGGTFDPIHNAHLSVATSALAQLNLHEVRFIPAGDPWQKRDRVITPASHRLEMLRLATRNHPQLVVDDCEVQRVIQQAQAGSATYTIDTLRELRTNHPHSRFVWIIGSDAFARLNTWREWRALFDYASFAVVSRSDSVHAVPTELQQELQEERQHRACSASNFTAQPDLTGRIIPISMPPSTVSSTQVRDCAKRRDFATLKTLVPAPVLEYITNHQLYI
jgi:nicotinate-nucleotide adenylyltransferase